MPGKIDLLILLLFLPIKVQIISYAIKPVPLSQKPIRPIIDPTLEIISTAATF